MELIKAKGGKVTREPGPVKGGKTVIAFIEDPDGYKFELLERGPTPEPFCQVMLRVGDMDRAINFYEKVRLNMELCFQVSLSLYHVDDRFSCIWILDLGLWYGAFTDTR